MTINYKSHSIEIARFFINANETTDVKSAWLRCAGVMPPNNMHTDILNVHIPYFFSSLFFPCGQFVMCDAQLSISVLKQNQSKMKERKIAQTAQKCLYIDSHFSQVIRHECQITETSNFGILMRCTFTLYVSFGLFHEFVSFFTEIENWPAEHKEKRRCI